MAPIPYVKPGEVIRSSLINQLIDIANGGGGAPAAGVPVPDVFGVALSQARSMIMQPSVNLNVGSVFDVFGTAISPNAQSAAARLVLGQSPPAFTRVTVGSLVNLTVAGTPQSGGGGAVPVGTVIVGDGVGPAGNINQNNTYEIKFPVNVAVNMEEKYDLKATVVGQSHASEWAARAVTGTSPNLQEITEITIPAAQPPNGITQDVRVELTVPNNTNGTQATLTLTVTSQRNAAIHHTSKALEITVGSPLPVPEQITIQFQSVLNGNVGAGNEVTVLPPQSRITYLALVPTAGPRTYNVTFPTAVAGFTPTLFGGSTTAQGSKQLSFVINVVKAGSPSPGALKIQLTDQNDGGIFGTIEQKLK